MIRLKDLLKESEEFQQLPTELKRHFLEIISTYGQHREGMTRKSDIRQVAETLGGIADAAQEYTLREGGDWFDRVTIKRNMGELKKLQSAFEKESLEAKAQEQRLESLYEDMGHVLGRYFEIADVSEDVMKSRLGLRECKTCKTPIMEVGSRVPKLYLKIEAVKKKIKELTDERKSKYGGDYARKLNAETDPKKKEEMLKPIQAITSQIISQQKNLLSMLDMEERYYSNMGKDDELDPNFS